MGSSSSSTAAAAAAAAAAAGGGAVPPPQSSSNPYMNYYGRSTEYSTRYFDEYCYNAYNNHHHHHQLMQQQQQQQSNNHLINQQQHHHHHSSNQLAAQQQQQHCTTTRELFQQQQQQPHSCSSSSSKHHHHHEKKKKWWKRRSSRSNDPGQPLRELLANWSLGEIVALVHEYESMTNEKELYIHAESARPRAPTLRQDLADLLDFKWNSDVNLVLPPAIFPAHRAILSQRAKYFRNILNNNSSSNVNVEDIPSVDIPSFSSLLRYLYTEEQPPSSNTTTSNSNNNSSASNHHHNHHHQAQDGGVQYLGTLIRPTKPLESDLRDLLQTGKYSDIVVILGDEQFAVHKPILAARSPFFRSLLQRRNNSKKIVLDDTVIPKRYARVILNCMYTDKLDLSLIEPSRSGLSEVENLTFTGKVNPSGFEEAMELYQIGRFLEFDHLCTASEDIIVESLSHETLPQILRWSSQSHGSSWVRRQAIMYVQEEYASLISTPSFLDLDKTTLLEVVQSDFLQASEVEVLNSIIKWGEHQLIKRVEDREPNLVSSTRDSVFRNNEQGDRGRKAGKRRGNDKCGFNNDIVLNDGELREIVFELIRCVRTDHIGLQHESLVGAVRRGLVSIPPTHMITEEKVNPWVNTLQCPNYIRPRLYTPYYEEAKSALRVRGPSNSTECLHYAASSSAPSHLSYLNSIGRIKTLRPIIPDTLYMIDMNSSDGAVYGHRHNNPSAGANEGGAASSKKDSEEHYHHYDKTITASAGGAPPEDEQATGRGVDEMVIDQEIVLAMVYREKKLRSAHLRNLSNPISRERASKYIRLRVVREFGFPDYVAEVLDHHNRTSLVLNPPSSSATPAPPPTSSSVSSTTAASSAAAHPPDSSSATLPPSSKEQKRSPVHYATPTPPADFHSNMPDVALNTTSEQQQQQLTATAADPIVVPFLDLDLGDNSGGVSGGNASTSSSALLQRARNRSFGSLRGSQGAQQQTQQQQQQQQQACSSLRSSQVYSSTGLLLGPQQVHQHPQQSGGSSGPYAYPASSTYNLYSTTSRLYGPLCSTSIPSSSSSNYSQPYATGTVRSLEHHHAHSHHPQHSSHHHHPHSHHTSSSSGNPPQQQQHHASSSSSTQSLRSIKNNATNNNSSHHVPSHYL